MTEFDAVEMVSTLMGGITKVGEAIQLVREPITVGSKVVIPAVVARLAVGAGGGSGRREGMSTDEHPKTGGGGGGGGGITLSPVFLVVDETGERLITVPDAVGSASAVIEKLTEVAGSVFSRQRARRETPAEASRANS
jgi:uncharacterized spore protein YtfJ